MTEIPVITEIIDATPAMIPTIVRKDLSLWAIIAETAIFKASKNKVRVLFQPAPRAAGPASRPTAASGEIRRPRSIRTAARLSG